MATRKPKTAAARKKPATKRKTTGTARKTTARKKTAKTALPDIKKRLAALGLKLPHGYEIVKRTPRKTAKKATAKKSVPKTKPRKKAAPRRKRGGTQLRLL